MCLLLKTTALVTILNKKSEIKWITVFLEQSNESIDFGNGTWKQEKGKNMESIKKKEIGLRVNSVVLVGGL